jgi:peptidyl-prolyl cis-trans isomerase D
MFDFIGRHKKLIQILLFLFIIPPFAFFGVDRLQSPVGTEAVAKVGDYRITQLEFNRALRERQEAIQRLAQGRAAPELLNSTELRSNVLEALIRQRTLLNSAERAGLFVSEAQLQRVIAEIPAFQSGGKFSLQLYQQFLRSQGMTERMFESKVRRDVVLQMLDQVVGGTGFVSRIVAERVARLSEQQREVSHFTVSPGQFVDQVKLEDDAAKKYYEAHPDEFRIPEQVRLEYVTLTVDALLGDISVDPSEVRNFYESNRTRFETEEQRQASHILIAVDAGSDAEAKRKARAKADDIYRQAKDAPGRFAELAKQHSQDPSSAAKGGNLGYFGRGVTPQAFEDAVFRLKVGELSPPVESVDGFHIIQLLAVRPGAKRTLDEARGEVENELKRQRAGKKFAEVAESFNNVVFEQSETLKPAAELARSLVRQSGWIMRGGAAQGDLNNPKLLQAIFSEDVIRNKRNTEAVEVAPGLVVAARVIEHKPSALQPFDSVSAGIVKKLTAQRAAQLAAQSGRELLEQLRQGKESRVTWSAPQLLGRSDAKGLGEAALASAYRVDPAKLPAYAGVEDGRGGFTLVRVTRIAEADKIAPERQKAIAEGLREMLGQEEMLAYVSSLKQKAGIQINKEALEKKQ